MIIGVGTDIAESCRIADAIEKFGVRFFEHIYAPQEIPAAKSRSVAFHAGRWAAKEAAAKAMGCGFGGSCHPAEIVVVNDSNGAPQLEFTGRTGEIFASLNARAHLSISHEKNYATAVVILEKTV